MTKHPSSDVGLWDELQAVYNYHLRYTFDGRTIEEQGTDWRSRSQRVAKIYFGIGFLPVALLRIRDRLLRYKVPLLPYICHMISVSFWHVSIGHYVDAAPGLLMPHGHVVIDGIVKIGRDCVINPWVTIGLSNSRKIGFDIHGPTIGDRVVIGTGAKLLGPITIGDDVRVGANAVVIDDVPSGATVVGMPARVVQSAPPEWPT